MKKQLIKDGDALTTLNREELKLRLTSNLKQILEKKNYLNVRARMALENSKDPTRERSNSILRQTQEDLKILQQQALNPLQKESVKMLAQIQKTKVAEAKCQKIRRLDANQLSNMVSKANVHLLSLDPKKLMRATPITVEEQ